MGMPVLGPPTSTPFSPLAPTLRQEQPAPMSYTPDPGSLRPAGSAYGLERLRGQMQDDYQPPAWAGRILVTDPMLQAPGDGANGQGGYQRPGLPERVNVNPFAADPLGEFLGGDAGVALGLTPGQQRGGAYNGIATAPITLQNFSTWGRERVLALATSLMGKDYQQPEGGGFGQQPELVGKSGDPVEAFVSGVAGVGDLVFKAFDAPLKWYRDSNAFNRGKQVRELFAKGTTGAQAIGSEMITTAIFGGAERYTMDGLRAAAAREGVDIIDVMAKRYDFDPRIVAAIAANPYMTDEELGTYTDGQPLSVDPVSNMGLELAMQGAMLAVGGVGVAKGAAMLGRSGVGALEALGTTLRGGAVAGDIGMGARAASTAGWLTRKALQLNSWNTTAGWTIGGAEWGIKQLAVIGGNDELVKAMDRLMWQMPLSMNPGWNLIDGFSSHPVDAYRNLRQGQVAIGRRGSPGYVGQLDLRGMALREGSTGETMSIRLAGRDIKLGRDSEEFRVLGRLKDLTPDDMHGLFFARLGWSKANLERVFGDGNPYDLTWDDARNALFHVALEAVRESKGPVGRLEGMHLPTMAERTAAFVRDNAKGSMKVLEDNLKGTSSSMLDLFKSDFWNLAARNDTRMGAIKASLGEWDPDMAFLDFASWVRASKVVRNAVEAGKAEKGVVPVFRQTVNREFLAAWLKELEKYGPDDVVPLSMVNQLKRFGGAVELRGKGGQLVRGRQAAFTRTQLEDIVDDILATDDLARKAANAVPRDQAAAYRKGMDPQQDPLEDARVLGISTTQLDMIRAAAAKAPEELTGPPPARLVQIVAADLGRSADSIMAMSPADAWATVIDWWQTKEATATSTAALRDNLDRMAQAITARAADGRMDSADAAAMVAGLGRIRDEVLAPLDPKLLENRRGLYDAWQATAQEGLILASEIETHLADEARNLRPAPGAPGTVHAVPVGVPEAVIKGYEKLIAKVLKDGSPFLSDFDRARLEDPNVHPLLKHDILMAALSPTDRVTLGEVVLGLGGRDPRAVVTEMLTDNGIDTTDPAAGAAAAAAKAEAYIEQGRDLGARAAQLARRFQTLGGAYSDEMADTIDRIETAHLVRKAAAKKGEKLPPIGQVPMDPEDGARRSVAAKNTERSAATRAMAKAQAQLDAAEKALADAAGQPTAFDEATMEWAQARVFRTGKADAKRAEAQAHAAELRRSDGAITRVWYDPKRSAYVVDTAQPKPQAPEAPAPLPVPTTIGRLNDAKAFEADLDRLLTAVSTSDRADAGMDLQMYGTPDIANPAYMPGGELDPLRATVERRLAAIEKDLADNPPADPARDPRITAQGKLAEMAGRFRQRDLAAQSARETAAVADGADPGLIDQAVQGRMDLGGTPESGGAMAADAGTRTQGGRIVLDQAGEAPQPHGTFPDPATNEPIGYQLMVVDAGQLITSADEGFDPQLQPRMRGVRQASDEQIAQIATNPDPVRLMGTESGAEGTPVILTDGQVLAGNGRTTGVRQAYADGQGEAYRAAVEAKAAELGQSTEGMAAPMIVRVIDVPREQAVRLAVQLNFATGMPLADKALGLSRLVTDEDIGKLRIGASQSLEEALASGSNDGFVQAFKEHIPEQYRNEITAADGSLNQDGIRIVAASLMARFTNASATPAGQQFIATLFEGDPEFQSLASGFGDAVGALIQAQVESVGRPWGGVTPAFAADLVPAIQRVFDLRKVLPNATAVREALEIVSMGLESADLVELTPAQRVLARNLAMLAQGGAGGGATGLRSLLRDVARRVRGHEEAGVEAAPMDLFGSVDQSVVRDPAYPDVVNDAFRSMNVGRPEGKQFDLLPGEDGITHVKDASGAETARLHPVIDSPGDVIASVTPTMADVVLTGNDWRLHTDAIGRSTGKVVLSVKSEAEATALRAFLAGDDSARLPAAYRVVDGAIEPMDEAKYARARELANREYKRAISKEQANAYLDLLESPQGHRLPTEITRGGRTLTDPDEIAAALASDWLGKPVSLTVVRKINGYLRAETAGDPALPALRDALAGRDFEVRGPGPVPLPETPAATEPLWLTRPKGDGQRDAALTDPVDIAADMLVRYAEHPSREGMGLGAIASEMSDSWTGESASASYSVSWKRTGGSIEVNGQKVKVGSVVTRAEQMMEARRARARVDSTPLAEGLGNTTLPRAADSMQPGALGESGQRPTEIVANTPRDIPDDYEAVTGLSPETPKADLAASEAVAAGSHRVVSSSDAVDQRAAQRASGAPVNRSAHVTEINAPDAVERTRLAQQARDTAAANVEAARAKLDALGDVEEAPPQREILSGSELDLYHRYIDSTATPAGMRQPRNINEVVDLLTSLDLGMPPLKGAMSPEEMETLRMALLRVLNARLDDLGVDPPSGIARRGGVGAKKSLSQGTGTRGAEPVMTTPDDLSADLADVMRTLQGRVYEASDNLAGWEGTQYEIGLLPSKGKDGGPLSPRLVLDDWISRLDEKFPTVADEILRGRKQAWPEREAEARWTGWMENMPGAALIRQVGQLAHTALDARPERVIAKQAIDRFTELLLKDFVGTQDEYLEAIGLIHGMVGKVHENMADHTLAGFQVYRRMGLAAPDKFQKWAEAAFEGGPKPQWYSAFEAKSKAAGIKHPLAEAWREADNRVRAYFASKPGGMADLIDGLYASSAGRKAHGLTRGLTVGYHVARFLIDLRWLGLEVVEAPTLTFFQEGPAAMLEGLGRGPNKGKMPMFMGRDALESSRTAWAWWLSQSDPGALLRTRERYLLAIVRRRQMQEFPRALREAMAKSPDLAAAVKAFDGGDESAWLKRLDTDWELAASRGQELTPEAAKRLFEPWFERGVISQKELDELLKAKRYTGHPAIDRELSTLAEPWMRPLIDRLSFLNEQGWNDAAKLIFGQTDRSNIQRLANHPLLYWPISYQLKAAKWLGGLLFDRAFGVDTGAGGAVTLGMIHQQHLDRMKSDEQYANAVVGNPTLLFFAQMLFPIAPWDMGVSLSPFTRLAMSALTADDATEGYRRNIFSVGPGYTYYSLLPRLFYEQSKPGSWAQGAGVIGDIMEAGQRFAPYSVPVQPKSTSQLYNAEIQAGQGAIPTTTESTGAWPDGGRLTR